MESPAKLAVAAQLDEYLLVEREADQVERLGDRGGGGFGHCFCCCFRVCVVGWWCVVGCVVGWKVRVSWGT